MRKRAALHATTLFAASLGLAACGNGASTPSMKDTGTHPDGGAPVGLILPGEGHYIQQVDSKYALDLQSTQTATDLYVQPIPATGTMAPPAQLVDQLPGVNNYELVSSVEKVFYEVGQGQTGCTLKTYDPATKTPATLKSGLPDGYDPNANPNGASLPFSVSPNGTWAAYMVLDTTAGGWDLDLMPAAGGSAVTLAKGISQTGSNYFYTPDSKYLVLTQPGTVMGTFVFSVTPLPSAGTMTTLTMAGAPTAGLDKNDDLYLVTSYSGANGAGELDMFPKMLGAALKIDTRVADAPQASPDGQTLYYVKAAAAASADGGTDGGGATPGGPGDLWSVSVATGAPGIPAKLQSKLGLGLIGISPDGKWLTYFTTAPSQGIPSDINVVSTTAGATSLNVGPYLGWWEWAPDASSFAAEINLDPKTGISPFAVVTFSGTTATLSPTIDPGNYLFHYRDAKTLVYDVNANSLASKSDWMQGPVPTGKPAKTVKLGVGFGELALVPPDNSRALFVIRLQASKDGLYLVTLPSE